MSPLPECHFYLHQGATAGPSRPICRQYVVNACGSLLQCGDNCVGIRWSPYPPVNTILSWDGRMIVWSPGWIGDQHPTPNYRLVICLAGALRFIGSGGETLTLQPGDRMMVMNTTGKGHATEVVSDVP
jgi:hypothetical protein